MQLNSHLSVYKTKQKTFLKSSLLNLNKLTKNTERHTSPSFLLNTQKLSVQNKIPLHFVKKYIKKQLELAFKSKPLFH